MNKRRFKTNPRQILDKRPNQQGGKAVPNLTAQSNRLLHTGTVPEHDLSTMYGKLAANKWIGKTELAVIELLLFYGCRISEVLRIGPTDVLSNGYIRIKGLKGSEDRLIYPHINYSLWVSELKLQLPLGGNYSRFYFYRLFKRLGIYQKFSGHKNYSVTHYYRHLLLRGFKSESIEVATRSRFIGHKSTKSTIHYG